MLRDPALYEKWIPVIADGAVRSCYPQRAEFLLSARDLAEYDVYCAMFDDLYDDVVVPKGAGRWISGLQHRAAERGAHKALSAVDLQICATAAHHGLVVLHDDADFVTGARLASELEQRSVLDGPA
ncbi:VapC toxin family PIN domain ribonuclease [Streptomyces beijiangensis]|uniref:VapC toxin family PIN domain ribonuclease n=2 Tax=Streptomyces beijiangensis TaxID=163361 RepID=A0A939FBU8_9ACTN|nr:VapC toxin family PIN domain ribonuclease [Streptomyces beijiangensis]